MWLAARIPGVTLFAICLLGQTPPPRQATPDPPEKLALAALRDYDYPAAEEFYRRALTQNPSSPDTNAGLVRALLGEKKLPAARVALEAALRQAPDAPPVLVAEGDVRLREGRIQDSEAAYKRALSLDPRIARGWFGMARIAYLNSMHRTAERAVNKAHDLDPDDPEIYDWWAVRLPRAERRRALAYLIDHHGHMDAERLNNLQSRLAWLIVLGDKPAWKLVSPANSAKLKLNHIVAPPRPDGFGPPTLRTTAVALHLQINGKKTVNLLVDTGASGVVLQRDTAAKAAVRPIYDIATKGIGDERAAMGYLGWVNSVSIGPLQFENVPMTVVDQRFPDGVDGLIGLDVFDRFLVTLDIQRGELDLAPLPELPDEYKDPDGSWDRYISPEMKDYLPVLHMSSHLLVPTSVDGRAPGLFFLDTGAFDSQVDSDYVSRDKLTRAPNLPVRGISGRVNDVFVANNVRLQFGHFVQENFSLVAISMDKMSENEGVGITGILGFPLLSQFRISIDYRDGLVYFDYKGAKR